MEDWIIGLLLALFIIAVYLAAFLRSWNDKRLDEIQVKVWKKLAKQTGLNLHSGFRRLEGKYHGYQICLWNYPSTPEDPGSQRTSITLWLNNSSNYTLSIKKKGINKIISNINDRYIGNEDFDRRFSIKGKPKDFALHASILISQTDPRLLDWAIQNRLSLELKGSYLQGRCYSMDCDLKIQISFLDLLCDLAGLAEQATRQLNQAGVAEITRIAER